MVLEIDGAQCSIKGTKLSLSLHFIYRTGVLLEQYPLFLYMFHILKYKDSAYIQNNPCTLIAHSLRKRISSDI